MTVNPIQTDIAWSTEFSNVQGITSSTDWNLATKDFNSCQNSDKIRSTGDATKYPAAWIAYNYQPQGTPNGKYWCLPAAGIVSALYNNLTVINLGIKQASGTQLEDSEYFWTSTEYDKYAAWLFCSDTNSSATAFGGIDYGDKDGSGYYNFHPTVRPVMEF